MTLHVGFLRCCGHVKFEYEAEGFWVLHGPNPEARRFFPHNDSMEWSTEARDWCYEVHRRDNITQTR